MSASEQMGPLEIDHVYPVAVRPLQYLISAPGVIAQPEASEVVGVDLMHECELHVTRVVCLPILEPVTLPAQGWRERGEGPPVEKPGKVRVLDLLVGVVQFK